MDQSLGAGEMDGVNSDWTPGRPVATPQDHAAWERWKRDISLRGSGL